MKIQASRINFQPKDFLHLEGFPIDDSYFKNKIRGEIGFLPVIKVTKVIKEEIMAFSGRQTFCSDVRVGLI